MLTSDGSSIASGSACVYTLPHDPTCASRARSLLATTMKELRFCGDVVADAEIAVSELATNALTHASTTAPAELWIWARSRPTPQLVVSVFDAHPESRPVLSGAGLLEEHGKGLAIVSALAVATGTHRTRSRTGAVVPGKSVWFTVPLPMPWPAPATLVPPALAAARLREALNGRGIPTAHRSDNRGITIINAGTLNVWVQPTAFAWCDDHGYARLPLSDLQEATERIVSCLESGRPPVAPA
ncbi:ATP-binding protein [Spirillospora sp. NPDC052242]